MKIVLDTNCIIHKSIETTKIKPEPPTKQRGVKTNGTWFSHENKLTVYRHCLAHSLPLI